jgi:hypothetical protein
MGNLGLHKIMRTIKEWLLLVHTVAQKRRAGEVLSKWQLLKQSKTSGTARFERTSISLLRAMISSLRVDHVDATRDDDILHQMPLAKTCSCQYSNG